MFVASSLSFVWVRALSHRTRLIPIKATRSYTSAINELFAIAPKGTRNVDCEVTRSRFEYFSNRFVELGLSNVKVIHVAGTKGKGSTVEYLNAGLTGCGHKVGVFTSPHLHSCRERIKIGRSLISKPEFIGIAESTLAAMKPKGWPVFFDMLLDMALQYFSEQGVDYIILETGIGGIYDSTNFIQSPVASVITSISLDHQALLGNTPEEIAFQKAGIIKNGCPLFTSASQSEGVLNVFRTQCTQRNAPIHIVPVNKALADELRIKLNYDVQHENVCVAASVLQYLNQSPRHMVNFYWPCRMETFCIPIPLFKSSSSSQSSSSPIKVVVDGCHNGHSVQVFLQGLRKTHPTANILVLFGAGIDKTVEDMMCALQSSKADQVQFVQSTHFRSMTETDLSKKYAEVLAKVGSSGSDEAGVRSSVVVNATPAAHDRVPQGTVKSTLAYILGQQSTAATAGETVIAVCGSLFAAAEAREEIFRLYPDLFAADDWVREADNVIIN